MAMTRILVSKIKPLVRHYPMPGHSTCAVIPDTMAAVTAWVAKARVASALAIVKVREAVIHFTAYEAAIKSGEPVVELLSKAKACCVAVKAHCAEMDGFRVEGEARIATEKECRVEWMARSKEFAVCVMECRVLCEIVKAGLAEFKTGVVEMYARMEEMKEKVVWLEAKLKEMKACESKLKFKESVAKLAEIKVQFKEIEAKIVETTMSAALAAKIGTRMRRFFL